MRLEQFRLRVIKDVKRLVYTTAYALEAKLFVNTYGADEFTQDTYTGRVLRLRLSTQKSIGV